MTNRLVKTLPILLALSTSLTASATEDVRVRVQWLPDPAIAADWDRAADEAARAAELIAEREGRLPPGVAALYGLLDRAGRDAVAVALADSDADASPVALARAVADEVPFAIDALCAEGGAWAAPCEALDRLGVSSIAVQAPNGDERSLEDYEVVFGLRPRILTCIMEQGCGDEPRLGSN